MFSLLLNKIKYVCIGFDIDSLDILVFCWNEMLGCQGCAIIHESRMWGVQ